MTVAEKVAWMPMVVLVASMPLYAVRGGIPDNGIEHRPASPLLSSWLRGWMVWLLGPVERQLVRWRVRPDVLNILGAAFGLMAGGAFIARALPLAAWLIAIGGICDILDGRIARARGLSSAYGGFLDSTLDRFGETFMFVGVAWYLSGSALLAAATVLAIGSSLLVSYARARGEALGVSGTGGLAQRAERLVLLALAALADPPLSGWLDWRSGTVLAGAVVVIAVGGLGTAGYRTVVIARTLARHEHESASVRTAPSLGREEPGSGVAAPP